jgi:DNA topoisomerase-2
MAGIQRLGRDSYGVFPLKGKLLNVNDITPKQLMENEELKSIIRIIGLEFGKEYTSTNQLRYTSIMVMADQDNDGSHIKGLILNFFHCFWPSLCRLPGFLREFVTPIVRCRKGEKTVDFFSLADY